MEWKERGFLSRAKLAARPRSAVDWLCNRVQTVSPLLARIYSSGHTGTITSIFQNAVRNKGEVCGCTYCIQYLAQSK